THHHRGGRGQNKLGLKKIEHALLSSQKTTASSPTSPNPRPMLFRRGGASALLCSHFIRCSVRRRIGAFRVSLMKPGIGSRFPESVQVPRSVVSSLYQGVPTPPNRRFRTQQPRKGPPFPAEAILHQKEGCDDSTPDKTDDKSISSEIVFSEEGAIAEAIAASREDGSGRPSRQMSASRDPRPPYCTRGKTLLQPDLSGVLHPAVARRPRGGDSENTTPCHRCLKPLSATLGRSPSVPLDAGTALPLTLRLVSCRRSEAGHINPEKTDRAPTAANDHRSTLLPPFRT
ncbi:hypothetical protein SAMN02745673_02046, partial [Marinactinospora thermotolerans DSM 45154]